MSIAFAGPATSFATTILSYFSPSKSPFYSVIAFGTASSLLTCERIVQISWLWLAVPIFIVLSLSAILSFRNRASFDEGQGEEQLRFARSFSISTALMTFVVTARSSDQIEVAFWSSYFACLAQITVFLLYTWARSETQEEQSEINFVQSALITTTFLIGASYGNVQYVAALLAEPPARHVADRYFIVACGLYVLWFCMLLSWVKHLRTLIRVDIPKSNPQRPPET